MRPRREKLTIPTTTTVSKAIDPRRSPYGLDARTLRTTSKGGRCGRDCAGSSCCAEVGPEAPLYSGVNGVTFAGPLTTPPALARPCPQFVTPFPSRACTSRIDRTISRNVEDATASRPRSPARRQRKRCLLNASVCSSAIQQDLPCTNFMEAVASSPHSTTGAGLMTKSEESRLPCACWPSRSLL